MRIYHETVECDSVLVGVKKTRFEVLKTQSIDHNELAEQAGTTLFKENNTGMILLIKERTTGKELVICSTHLYFSPRKDFLKVGQAANCLKHLDSFDPRVRTGELPVIFAGDFNAYPTETGVVNYVMGKEVSPHPMVNKKNIRKYDKIMELIPETPSLVGKFENSYSAFSEEGYPKWTNYTQDFKETLDHIFYT